MGAKTLSGSANYFWNWRKRLLDLVSDGDLSSIAISFVIRLTAYFEADDVHLRPFSHSSRGCLGHSTDLILYCYGRRPKGFWTGWTSWSACSMDNHVRTRFRTCQKTPASARTWRYDCLHKKNSTSVEGISRNLLTYLLTKDSRIRPRQISCR